MSYYKIKDTFIRILITAVLTYGIIGIMKYSGLLDYLNSIHKVGDNVVMNTGSTITSSGTTNTGNLSRLEYLSNLSGTGLATIESKINYVFSFGEKESDFITRETYPQDIVLGNTKDLNNILIQSFVQKHQYTFTIDRTRESYLVVKTRQKVKNDKDMILAINGKRLGSFHKGIGGKNFKSDISDSTDDGYYIFPTKSIDIAQFKSLVNLATFDPLNISIVIGDNDNAVTSISIVYIN